VKGRDKQLVNKRRHYFLGFKRKTVESVNVGGYAITKAVGNPTPFSFVISEQVV